MALILIAAAASATAEAAANAAKPIPIVLITPPTFANDAFIPASPRFTAAPLNFKTSDVEIAMSEIEFHFSFFDRSDHFINVHLRFF
jgi:hypothetical protein